MKKKFIQQEVLLITNSSFANRQWCKNGDKTELNFTQEEKLEEACANGLIQELLPEIFNTTDAAKMYLWQMHPGFSFVQLELGELPIAVERDYSLNPHQFLPTIWYN